MKAKNAKPGTRVQVKDGLYALSGRQGIIADFSGTLFDVRVLLDGEASSYGFDLNELRRVN